MGLVLGPVRPTRSTARPRDSYGAVTGVTQTVRNFAGSLGLAVLGSVLISQNKSNLISSLGRLGVPASIAHGIAHKLSSNAGSERRRRPGRAAG